MAERTGQRDKVNELLATLKGKVEVMAEQNSQLLAERKALNQQNSELIVSLTRLESEKEQLLITKEELVAKVNVLQDRLDKMS